MGLAQSDPIKWGLLYSKTWVECLPLEPQKSGRYSEGGHCSEVRPKYYVNLW